MKRCASWLTVIMLATACGRPVVLRSSMRTMQPSVCPPATSCSDSVQITYLGVGGFVLRHGSQGLLTAPSFTHPGLFAVISGRSISSDTALVRGQLEKAGGILDVSTILVGHSHYDHLLDVPYAASRARPDVRVYGSPTMKHILTGDAWLRDGAHLFAIDSVDVGDATRPGTWTYPIGGGFRFMALRSSHAPNWLGFTLAQGMLDRDLEHLPRSAWGYRMGEPYAWLIDVLSADSRPIYRVLYQDAASRAEFNELPPLEARDRRPVDLAIICGANFDGAGDYPTHLIRAIAPQYVLVAHWENFFRSPADSLAPVPFLKAEELVRRLDSTVGGRWMAPRPMVRTAFVF